MGEADFRRLKEETPPSFRLAPKDRLERFSVSTSRNIQGSPHRLRFLLRSFPDSQTRLGPAKLIFEGSNTIDHLAISWLPPADRCLRDLRYRHGLLTEGY